MGRDANVVDLPRLALSHGEGRRIDIDLAADSLSIAGQDYVATEDAAARLEVSRTTHGYAFHLVFDAHVRGPCVRCLEGADVGVTVDSREVEEPAASDEELRSPYVTDEVLDVGRWAHDALLLAMPQKLLCRADCAGLCPVCGESLNDADPKAHEHETPKDPRFAKLDELRFE
jgi:uncharacterized protein